VIFGLLWFIFYSQELEKTKVFICSSIYIRGGEYQMKKGDKGKKLFGVIVILQVSDSRI